MADIDLSQVEANALIALEKLCDNNDRYDFPSLGKSLIIPLHSRNRREQFLLDIGIGRTVCVRGNETVVVHNLV